MRQAANRSARTKAAALLVALLAGGCTADGTLQPAWTNGGEAATATATAAAMSASAGGSSVAAAAVPTAETAAGRRTAADTAAQEGARNGEDDAFSFTALQQRIHAAFTPSAPPTAERQRLGDALARKVLQNSRALRDDALQARLEAIVARLAGPAREESAFPQRWQLHVIDSGRSDAFTSGGGHLFITRGMVELLGSDERIATVLAHEMAHNLLAHVWSAREKKELARKAHKFSRDVLAEQMKLAWLGKSVSFLVRTSLNTYSRQQEYDADALGLHLLVRAGYPPQAALDTFDHLRRRFREESGLKNFFYSHHPLYERRRWYIANRIRAHYRKEAGLPEVRRRNWN